MWGMCLCVHVLSLASFRFREAVIEVATVGQTFEVPEACMALPESVQRAMRNSLAVQWLGLHAFIAGGTGSIPGRRIKIPQAMWPAKKTPKNRQKKRVLVPEMGRLGYYEWETRKRFPAA